jgi:HD superfamily phosphohydrolase
MRKAIHEIRDPIHVFIKVDTQERTILDSRPFQRLRYIHQLAMTYLVYPGATHRRFEHSLGVMEVASRIFDVITNPQNVRPEIADLLPEITDESKKSYWRQVLRAAALCHDMGHLPFSHAAEKELLPEGWNHERLTRELIQSDEMMKIWNNLTPPLRAEDIIKLAVGPKEASELHFSDGEAIFSEIIVGDAFGADRIDYLIRDSYHTGVAYGKFDHYRLIDTLRILSPPLSEQNSRSTEPMLGIEEGGLQSAEALLLARYFMYSQVYLHPVRRIYDIHLKDFLREWRGGEKFPINPEGHLSLTDNEILTAIKDISRSPSKKCFEHANRIINRKHFKLLDKRNLEDLSINPFAFDFIYNQTVKRYGQANIRLDSYNYNPAERTKVDFPVLDSDGRIISAFALSNVLKNLPPLTVNCIFIEPELQKEAMGWLKKNRHDIIKNQKKEES